MRARRSWGPLAVVVAIWGLATAGAPQAVAQERAAEFAERPILVLDTGGHNAPVRRLLFTRDESRLLSAGDDKVVRVWDLTAPSPTLGWTIRPPIWRGSAGAIYAMALTPADAQGNQTLALAGYGVTSLRGEIGLFRFPGAVDRRQGDVDAYLAGGDAGPLLQSRGHVQPVAALAFDPTGALLASSGNDRTVRLWDPRARTQLAVASPADQGAVNSLAFTPNGQGLVTGGSDGIVRVWNVAARTLTFAGRFAIVPPSRDQPGLAINALDVGPDGRSVVVGREDGNLYRYDLANLAAPPVLAPNARGAVETLAIGPDGRVATSVIAQVFGNPADRPSVACAVEIRRLADLAVTEAVAVAPNLVLAVAWSPGGRYLAYAGGDQQEIRLKDLRNPPNFVELSATSARGASVWDVGFAGNLAVAYSNAQPSAPPVARYWGFNLKDRSRTTFPREQVSRAVPTFGGWSVRPAGPLLLDVFLNNAFRFRVELSPELDGRWWAHTFLPPGPRHDRPALAIACRRGVVVYRLDDRLGVGQRTRFLDGHSGDVYTLAPSPDNKWLATGSADQTIRLWPLAGIDALPPLGASFERRGAGLAVTAVEPAGFADVAGLRVGDLIDKVGLAGQEVTVDVFLRDVASSPPNSRIEFIGRRARPAPIPAGQAAEEPVRVGTTKRDRPALALFVGFDREWALWMPRGFYDSSVLGDSNFLGWQVNRSTVAVPRPTDFYPLLTHEKLLRQPRGTPGNLIDRLLDGGDEAALGVPPAEQQPVVEANRPAEVSPYLAAGGTPVRTVAGQPIAVGAPLPEVFLAGLGTVTIDWRVSTWKAAPPGPVEVRVDNQVIRAAAAPDAFDPAIGVATVAARPEASRAGVYQITAVSDRGSSSERWRSVTAKVDGPTPPKPNTLRVVAIAPTFADPAIPPIRAAGKDAEALSAFLPAHLVSESRQPFRATGSNFLGANATAANVLGGLKALGDHKGTVERGDLVVVVIESYLAVQSGQEGRLVVADSRGSPPSPDSTVPIGAISAILEGLVRRGCRAVVVLDGVHAIPGNAWETDAVEWARRLRNELGVITIVASTRRPIRDEFVGANRPLAGAILDTVKAARRDPKDTVLTLADTRKAIVDRVMELTKNTGEPMVYIPRGLDAGLPFLDQKPNPPASVPVAGGASSPSGSSGKE